MAAQKGHIRAVTGSHTLETRDQLAQISELVGRTDRITLLQRSAAVDGAQCGANDQIARLAAGKRSE